MLKLGTYGFLRFGLYLFPDAAHWWAPLFITLGVIGIIYGAICATMQRDLKRLVAYSSVAHLGFIVLGTFALTTAEHLGRRDPDGQPRRVDRRPVPPRRLDLRAAPHPPDRRAARPPEGGADLRRRLHRGDAVVDRRARPERLRRRVPRADRLVPHRPLVGGRGRHRRDPRRRSTCSGPTSGCSTARSTTPTATSPSSASRRASSSLPLIGLIFFMGIYPKPVLDRIEPSVRQPHRPRRGPLRLPPADRRHRRRGGRRVSAVLAQVGPRSPGRSVDWFALTPLIILTGGALVLLMLAGALVPSPAGRR